MVSHLQGRNVAQMVPLIWWLPAECLEGEESADDDEGEDEGAVIGRLLAPDDGLLERHPRLLLPWPGLNWVEALLIHGHVASTTWFEHLCWSLTNLPQPSCLPLPPPPSLSPFKARSQKNTSAPLVGCYQFWKGSDLWFNVNRWGLSRFLYLERFWPLVRCYKLGLATTAEWLSPPLPFLAWVISYFTRIVSHMMPGLTSDIYWREKVLIRGERNTFF